MFENLLGVFFYIFFFLEFKYRDGDLQMTLTDSCKGMVA